MGYVRKTRDVWDIEVNYGHGWEYATGHYTRAEAMTDLRAYRANAPEYPARMRKRRERVA